MRPPPPPGCHVPVINNLQMLDRETRALGLSKDLQEGVLFMWVAAGGGRLGGMSVGGLARPLVLMCWLCIVSCWQDIPSPSPLLPPSPLCCSTYSTLVSPGKGGRNRLDQ
jgi:hypothetical protein